MLLKPLCDKWDAKLTEWKRYDAHVSGAAICAEFLDDLERFELDRAEEQLTLAEAAEEAGCSEKTLRRRVSAGTLPHERRGNRLIVRRAHVRHTGGKRKKRASYDPTQDAKAIIESKSYKGDRHGKNAEG